MIQEETKGKLHLGNALRLNFDNYILIEDLFPVVWNRKWFKTILQNIKITMIDSLKMRFGLLGRNISYSFSKGHFTDKFKDPVFEGYTYENLILGYQLFY